MVDMPEGIDLGEVLMSHVRRLKSDEGLKVTACQLLVANMETQEAEALTVFFTFDKVATKIIWEALDRAEELGKPDAN